MKKVLMLTAFIATIFGCKKEAVQSNNVIDVTFKKDASVQDQTIQPPKNGYVISSGILNTGSVNAFQLASVEVSLKKGGDAVEPKDYLKRVYFTIEDGTGVTYTSTIKNLIVNSTFTFDNFLKNYGQYKTLTIKLYADILSTATNSTGLEDNLTVEMKLFYTHGGSANPQQTSVMVGQTLTFRGATSSTLISNSLNVVSSGALFVSGQTFTADSTDFTSIGGTSTIKKISVLLFGGNEEMGNGISQVKVYDGSILVGTGTFSSRRASVDLNLDVISTKNLTFRLVVGQVVNLASAADGNSTEFTITQVDYIDAGGDAKILSSGFGGMKFSLMKSRQVVTSIPFSGVIQNNVLSDGFKFKIESIGDKSSNHQFGFNFTLTDNPIHADTLYYKNLYVKVNNSLYSARLTNANEKIIDSVGPCTTKVFVTFVSGTGEVVTNPGPGTEFIIGGRWVGFNHPLDPDNASIEIDTTRVVVGNGFRYINTGIAPNNLVSKIFSSPGANIGAIISPYIWSDYSATGHSSVPGSSSMDAKTASMAVIYNTFKQVWHQ